MEFELLTKGRLSFCTPGRHRECVGVVPVILNLGSNGGGSASLAGWINLIHLELEPEWPQRNSGCLEEENMLLLPGIETRFVISGFRREVDEKRCPLLG
jgi:hypothetical protein